MRWWLFLLGILLLPLVVALEPWGCCVTDTMCFDGSAYSTQEAFQNACENAGSTPQGQGVAITCDSFPDCITGCCCATVNVSGSALINSTEQGLQQSRRACELKTEDYVFVDMQGADTCVQLCGGYAEPPAGAFTITGKVLNGSQPVLGATAFIPIQGGGSIQDVTGADGRYTLENVPEMRSPVFALHPACQPAQTEPLDVDSDLTNVFLQLQCEDVSCTHQTPEFLQQPENVQGTADVSFVMQLLDDCNDFLQYEPQRCDKDGLNCLTLPPETSPTITDRGLQPGTTYCYNVTARFAGSESLSVASLACVTTGDPACLDRPEGVSTWCGTHDDQQAILSCDEGNVLSATACESGEVCSTRTDTPQCVPAPRCDMCNGLYGLFPYGNWKILDGATKKACDSLCFLDSSLGNNPLMVDAFTTCLTVAECADYRSDAACGTDECGLSDCEWITVNEELGQGICNSPSAPACERCEEFFGYCNTNACSLISPECYYDKDDNDLAQALGCIHKDAMACRYYDTEEHCVADGPNAEYDIQYNSTGGRTGTTNARVQDSQDVLGIGACSWTGDHCIKDADMNTNGEDDCLENNHFYTDPRCFEDSTPPNTTFFPKGGASTPIYGRAEIRDLTFSVYDDQTPLSQIDTYVCFYAGCYPTETLSQISLPEEGAYTMRYYSRDKSENSEVVKEQAIIIQETAQPALVEATIEENQ